MWTSNRMWPSALVLGAFVVKALAALNLDSSSNAVGICYSVWHSLGFDGSQPPDITEILIGNPDVSFGSQGAWHYWGRPEGGYYAGSDRAVLGRHFNQISGAGIDFIVIDATNLVVSRIPIDNARHHLIQRFIWLTILFHYSRDMVATRLVFSLSLLMSSLMRCSFDEALARLREF